jgi:hypothetical protein
LYTNAARQLLGQLAAIDRAAIINIYMAYRSVRKWIAPIAVAAFLLLLLSATDINSMIDLMMKPPAWELIVFSLFIGALVTVIIIEILNRDSGN